MTVAPFVPNGAQSSRSWSTHELTTFLSIYEVMVERATPPPGPRGRRSSATRSFMSGSRLVELIA